MASEFVSVSDVSARANIKSATYAGSRAVKEKLVSLQVLRAVAATMVVYHHSIGFARDVTGFRFDLTPPHIDLVGAAGVDIFFIVSGFVVALTGPLATPRPAAGVYFWQRFSRVAPPFYVLSLPALLIYLAPTSALGAGGSFDVGRTVASLFFWPAAGPEIESPYLSVGWTLCLEMIFYVTVSLLLIGSHLRRNLVIVTILFFGLGVARLFVAWGPIRVLANPIFLEFLGGAGLALVRKRLFKYPASLGGAAIGAALLLYFAESIVGPGAINSLGTMDGDQSVLRLCVFGFPSLLIVGGGLVFERLLAGPIVWLLAKIGNASYALYLVHLPVLFVLDHLWRLAPGGKPSPAFAILTAIIASVLAALATYEWLERPLISGVRKLGTRASQVFQTRARLAH